MQTHAAITHARHGMYRIARFIAWAMSIVTFLAIIGHGFSDNANLHTMVVLLGVLVVGVGALLLLPSALHVRYQRSIATALLFAGIFVCLML